MRGKPIIYWLWTLSRGWSRKGKIKELPYKACNFTPGLANSCHTNWLLPYESLEASETFHEKLPYKFWDLSSAETSKTKSISLFCPYINQKLIYGHHFKTVLRGLTLNLQKLVLSANFCELNVKFNALPCPKTWSDQPRFLKAKMPPFGKDQVIKQCNAEGLSSLS